MMNERIISKITENEYTTTIKKGYQTQGNDLYEVTYKTVFNRSTWNSFETMISQIKV